MAALVWRLSSRRGGSLHDTASVRSDTEGYLFQIQLTGEWRLRRGTPEHHEPGEVAIDHALGVIRGIARGHGLPEAVIVQSRANARLGLPLELPDSAVTLLWAKAEVWATPQDSAALVLLQRRRAESHLKEEEARRRLGETTAFRDALREDPTLALAHLLLERPDGVNPAALESIDAVAALVASYAPGAAAVRMGRVLAEFGSKLEPDARSHLVQRVCALMEEFGEIELAKRLQGAFDEGGSHTSTA